MTLSRNTNTPIPFFLSCPLLEFKEWVKANNEIIRENKQKKP